MSTFLIVLIVVLVVVAILLRGASVVIVEMVTLDQRAAKARGDVGI
jgi:hypothetical protein